MASPGEVLGCAPQGKWRSTSLSLCPRAAGGLGRSQPTRRWLRPGSEGSEGSGGGGRAGEPGPPGRDPGQRGVGFWVIRGVRSAEGASALERTWSPTSPLLGHFGRNSRNSALRAATAPCSLPTPRPSTWVRGKLSEAAPLGGSCGSAGLALHRGDG